MKVSVYCLVYNHEKYLRDCLEGFVNQITNFEYEVFVHDDASTDNSAKIIKEYEDKYPNIIKPIYQKENQYSKGIAISSTYIFPKMKGEYVAICEGDDYWCDNTKLQQQVDFLDDNLEYSACVHNTKMIDLFNNKETVMYDKNGDYDLEFKDVIKGGGVAYHTSSVMYRLKYIYDRPLFFKKANGVGDYPLAILLSINGNIRFINKIMSVYRFGSENSWTKRNVFDSTKMINHYKSINNMLKEVDNYTNYKYNDLIESIILHNKYNIELSLENYGILIKAPYKEIFDTYPLTFKLKVFIKYYFKFFYNIYKQIKH